MSPSWSERAAGFGAPVTLGVAVLLAVVYALLGSERDLATLFFALHSSQLGEEGWFRLFTASAMHADLQHLTFNLLGLTFLGTLLEPRLGSVRFTCVLLGSALAAALVTTGLSASPSVGASGAVYGLLGALLVASREIARARGERPPSLAILALLLVPVALENMRSGIDHWAHAGGAAGGALLGILSALQRSKPSAGLRASALVLAGAYAVAGTAGWAEYRLTEASSEMREWNALHEHAWRVATDVAASRGELERDRDRMRQVLAHSGGKRPSLLDLRWDLRDNLADTLATLHHRLGEHSQAVGIEREIVRGDEDAFFVSQLARFEWAELHETPAPPAPQNVEVARIDARAAALELRLPEPRAEGWSVDVLCSERGKLLGVLRISAGVEVRTPVRLTARAQWPPNGAMLQPVHAASARGISPQELDARYWPLHADVKDLP